MLATKIKMKPGCAASLRPEDIEAVYLTGGVSAGYLSAGQLWAYLDYNPGSVRVNVAGYPVLTAAGGPERRLLCSALNAKGVDYLFSLPRA